MIEVKGDFFEYAEQECPEVLVCTINQIVRANGELVMGAGIAKAFRDKYRGLAAAWGAQTKYKESGVIYSISDCTEFLVGFPTKYDWKDKSDIELIKKSLKELEQMVDDFSFDSVLMTRPGCGNGGFEWSEIRPLLKHLDERYIVICPE